MVNIINCFRNPVRIGLAILNRCFYWLPDKLFLTIKYRLTMGTGLDLKKPRTFQEKIQWLKLNCRDPEYTVMVDKLKVKKFISDRIGEDYIIPTLGEWNTFDEIDFNTLPDKFILKTSHGGGSCGVVVCRNKSNFDKIKAKEKLNTSMKTDGYIIYREWPYKNVVRKIFAEELIETPEKSDLTDYKIFCFNGEPKYIQVIQNRSTKETIDFFDTDWNHQEFYGLNPNCLQSKFQIPRPDKLREMLSIAEELSKGVIFLRVDLYYVNNRIYFGELTFYPAAGLGTFTPNEWNLKMGNLIQLPIH